MNVDFLLLFPLSVRQTQKRGLAVFVLPPLRHPWVHLAMALVLTMFLAVSFATLPMEWHGGLVVGLLVCGGWLMWALHAQNQKRLQALWAERRARHGWMPLPSPVSPWAWQAAQERIPFVLLPSGDGVEGGESDVRWEWFPAVREQCVQRQDANGVVWDDFVRRPVFVLTFRFHGQVLDWGVLCPAVGKRPFALSDVVVPGLRADMRLYGRDRIKSFVGWNPSSLQSLNALPYAQDLVFSAIGDTLCVCVPQAWMDEYSGAIMHQVQAVIKDALGGAGSLRLPASLEG